MTDSAGINSIIARAVVLLCSDVLYGPRMSNSWLPAVTWTTALTQSGQIIDPALGSIDARRFKSVMSKSILFGGSMTHFDTTNESGMFRVTSFSYQFYFYYAGKNKQVSYPIPLNSAWKEKANRAAVNVLSI